MHKTCMVAVAQEVMGHPLYQKVGGSIPNPSSLYICVLGQDTKHQIAPDVPLVTDEQVGIS